MDMAVASTPGEERPTLQVFAETREFSVSVGDGGNPSPLGEAKVVCVAMRRYQLGAVPKYRKRVLTGQGAVRARDVLRQIAVEHEIDIITGKVASDHVHMFIQYKPHQDVSRIVQGLKGISSRVMLQEFAHLRKQSWGRHLWARGHLATRFPAKVEEHQT